MDRMARWLLKLYPKRWRARYEAELLAVLEQHKVSGWTLFDLLCSASAAHLDAMLAGGAGLKLMKMKWGISAVFCAFVVFGVAYLPILRVPDPMSSYIAATQSHPEVQTWFQATRLCGEFACLAIVIGGLPVLYTCVKCALPNRERQVMIAIWTAVACLLVFLAATGLLALTHIINGAVVLSYLLLFVILLTMGTYSVVKTVMRGQIQQPMLRFALWCGVAAGIGMVCTMLCAVRLTVLIHSDLPQLTTTQDTNVPMLMISVAVMLVAVVVAVFGLVKGFTGRQDLQESVR